MCIFQNSTLRWQSDHNVRVHCSGEGTWAHCRGSDTESSWSTIRSVLLPATYFGNVIDILPVTTDTYTEDQLIWGSSWLLHSSHVTKLQIYTALRDRCMLLISSASAFHGNNICSLLLSDLAVCDVPMFDIGLGAKVMVCTIIWLSLILSPYCFTIGPCLSI